ncbi:XRE family transcriptional regulator [Fusibacter sp. A1]|nr:XRE family transcriptional regulator [Fusibacter sp. A1]
MDCKKTGEIIYTLRTEKGLTQLQLANELSISDKTVSSCILNNTLDFVFQSTKG